MSPTLAKALIAGADTKHMQFLGDFPDHPIWLLRCEKIALEGSSQSGVMRRSAQGRPNSG
jgi:hypothetical protein